MGKSSTYKFETCKVFPTEHESAPSSAFAMSGRLETVKKIQPIYKSPDKWDKHLSMHVQRGMQGSWDRQKYKEALTPYECTLEVAASSTRNTSPSPHLAPRTPYQHHLSLFHLGRTPLRIAREAWQIVLQISQPPPLLDTSPLLGCLLDGQTTLATTATHRAPLPMRRAVSRAPSATALLATRLSARHHALATSTSSTSSRSSIRRTHSARRTSTTRTR